MHLKVTLKLNSLSLGLILDTGASATVFDLALIKQIQPGLVIENSDSVSAGLGTTSMQSFRATVRGLSIGRFNLANFKAALLDLSHINIAYRNAGLLAIEGVLGNDVLEKFKARIDYAHLTLRLSRNFDLWHRSAD